MCEISQNMQKSKTRDISMGESVVSISEKQEPFSRLIQARPTSKIIAPGDLVISEHYCQYCGVSCNSTRQWDEHCMSEKHVENVNSDKEHQWNYRQPPWGQGNNLALCAKYVISTFVLSMLLALCAHYVISTFVLNMLLALCVSITISEINRILFFSNILFQ